MPSSMPSRLIETKAGTFFATKRFDRTNTGGRLHFASAAGAGENPTQEDLDRLAKEIGL